MQEGEWLQAGAISAARSSSCLLRGWLGHVLRPAVERSCRIDLAGLSRFCRLTAYFASSAGWTTMTGSDRTSYAGGFADLDDEVGPLPLSLQGDVSRPGSTGSLLRTGPAKFDVGSTTVNHWFDGMAMLHRFASPTVPVTYANRFLRSDSYCEAAVKGLAGARRVRHRPLPHAVPARRRGVLAASHRQLQRQRRRVRWRAGGADGDDAARALRRRDVADARATTRPAPRSAAWCRSRIRTTTPRAAAASATSSISAASSHYRLFAIPDDGSPERSSPRCRSTSRPTCIRSR